jgi:hypothetical protein
MRLISSLSSNQKENLENDCMKKTNFSSSMKCIQVTTLHAWTN